MIVDAFKKCSSGLISCAAKLVSPKVLAKYMQDYCISKYDNKQTMAIDVPQTQSNSNENISDNIEKTFEGTDWSDMASFIIDQSALPSFAQVASLEAPKQLLKESIILVSHWFHSCIHNVVVNSLLNIPNCSRQVMFLGLRGTKYNDHEHEILGSAATMERDPSVWSTWYRENRASKSSCKRVKCKFHVVVSEVLIHKNIILCELKRKQQATFFRSTSEKVKGF